MTNKSILLVLPLFDGSAPVSAALDDKDISNFGGIVSRIGDSYWLHRTDDLVQLAHRPGGPTKFSFADAIGQSVKAVTAQMATDVGLDLVDPQSDSVIELCRRLQSDLLIANAVQSASCHTMVTVFVNPKVDMRLVRQRYICSIGQESYDEQAYSQNCGQCPVHHGGTLR